MTRREKLSVAIYLAAIIAGIGFTIFAFCKCGSPNPTQTAARTAAFVMRALCSDEMTVKECGDLLEERAGFLEQDGGHE